MTCRKKAFLAVLALVVIGAGGLAIWQRDNINAVIKATRFSQEELDQQLQQVDQDIKDALSEFSDITVRDVTEEEKQALRDGTVTKEELVLELVQPQPDGQAQNRPDASEQGAKSEESGRNELQSTYEQQLSAIVAEVYVLRQEFLIKLDQLLQQAKAQYLALPADKRSSAQLARMVTSYMAQGLSMEKECDARMEEIIARMTHLVRENDQSTEVVETVYNTYLEEKELKKAWYMAELKERGLI